MRRLGGRFATEAAPTEQALVSDELRTQLMELLYEDIERLRDYSDAGFDDWSIA